MGNCLLHSSALRSTSWSKVLHATAAIFCESLTPTRTIRLREAAVRYRIEFHIALAFQRVSSPLNGCLAPTRWRFHAAVGLTATQTSLFQPQRGAKRVRVFR